MQAARLPPRIFVARTIAQQKYGARGEDVFRYSLILFSDFREFGREFGDNFFNTPKKRIP